MVGYTWYSTGQAEVGGSRSEASLGKIKTKQKQENSGLKCENLWLASMMPRVQSLLPQKKKRERKTAKLNSTICYVQGNVL
jgi:hypothetical protein